MICQTKREMRATLIFQEKRTTPDQRQPDLISNDYESATTAEVGELSSERPRNADILLSLTRQLHGKSDCKNVRLQLQYRIRVQLESEAEIKA